MFDRIHLWSHLVLDFCLLEDFLIMVSISLLVIGLFIFSISFLFSLGKLDLSKNLSISSWLSILLTYICFLVSYASLFFCGVSCNIFLFISNFIYLRHLPFFLLSLAKGLSILFFFSKNQLLVLLFIAVFFLVSTLFISALIFMISFLLLILGFVYSSFSSCFRCMFRLFIWDFSCFLTEDCIASLLELLLLHSIGFESWCFHCHLFLGIFLVSSLISSVISWLFSSILFSLQEFVFYTIFFFL